MTRPFASQGDLSEKTISFDAIGEGVYAFTAEGDPNSGVIIGDDSVMVIEAQATPRLARQVIERVRSVTDKPISHLVLTHYHAVRVLGASAYGAGQVIMSDAARGMVAERGQEDWESEFARFPRLFDGHEEIPGLTWPTTTFSGRMTVWLGRRRVDLMHLGRAHTAGDIVVHVPDQNVLFTGDIVEDRSAFDPDGSDVAMTGIVTGTVRVAVPGRHNALNAAAALLACRLIEETQYAATAGSGAFRLDMAIATAALGKMALEPQGRGQVIELADGITLIDESYNANPASVRAALETLSLRSASRRRVAVLGDMLELGADAAGLHAGLADAVTAAGATLYCCGPMMRHLFDAVAPDRRGAWAASSKDLEPILLEALRPGDIIMIKGSLGSRMAMLTDAVKARYAKPSVPGESTE